MFTRSASPLSFSSSPLKSCHEVPPIVFRTREYILVAELPPPGCSSLLHRRSLFLATPEDFVCAHTQDRFPSAPRPNTPPPRTITRRSIWPSTVRATPTSAKTNKYNIFLKAYEHGGCMIWDGSREVNSIAATRRPPAAPQHGRPVSVNHDANDTMKVSGWISLRC